jgi:hypothetical protein
VNAPVFRLALPATVYLAAAAFTQHGRGSGTHHALIGGRAVVHSSIYEHQGQCELLWVFSEVLLLISLKDFGSLSVLVFVGIFGKCRGKIDDGFPAKRRLRIHKYTYSGNWLHHYYRKFVFEEKDR